MSYSLRSLVLAVLVAGAVYAFAVTSTSWRCLTAVKAHQSNVVAVDWSPDGRWLLTGDETIGEVLVWEAQSGRISTRYRCAPGVSWARFGRGGQCVIVGHRGGQVVEVRASASGTRLAVLHAAGALAAWCLSVAGREVAIVEDSPPGSECTLRVWDLGSSTELGQLTGCVGIVCRGPIVVGDNSIVARASGSGTLVWQLPSGESFGESKGFRFDPAAPQRPPWPEEQLASLVEAHWLLRGQRDLVSESFDGQYAIGSGSPEAGGEPVLSWLDKGWPGGPSTLLRLDGEDDYLTRCMFSPVDHRLAIGTTNGTVKILAQVRPPGVKGLVYVPALWLLLLFGVLFVLSVRRDRKHLRAHRTASRPPAHEGSRSPT
jgi:WD40 repeat protein